VELVKTFLLARTSKIGANMSQNVTMKMFNKVVLSCAAHVRAEERDQRQAAERGK